MGIADATASPTVSARIGGDVLVSGQILVEASAETPTDSAGVGVVVSRRGRLRPHLLPQTP
jgi:hypothetical protein